jgi:hypothetical protein
MTWKGIVGRGVTVPELKDHIAGLSFTSWRPSLIVIHNTAAPSLQQWMAYPEEQRIRNLENYFRNDRGWSSGPHAFIAPDRIWLFTPFTTTGTHSPSWNGISIGLEFVGDFAREDDDSGPGLKVRKNGVATIALLCAKLGLNPETCIRLHKEDPRTTHDCPGRDLAQDRAAVIGEVLEFMGTAGEHLPGPLPIYPTPAAPAARRGQVNTPGDTLNLRAASSASASILAELPHGEAVEVLSEAMNGKTKWFRVKARELTGWAAARYIKI